MSIFTEIERELCWRTKENLDFILEAKSKGANVYETTQVFNSLLGILINLHENCCFSETFERIKIRDIAKEWKIPTTSDTRLSAFIMHMRHAIAHMSVEFDGKQTEQIKRVKFDCINEANEVYWACSFPICDLYVFLTKLCDFVMRN